MPAANPKRYRKHARKRRKKVSISALTAIFAAMAIIVCVCIPSLHIADRTGSDTGASIPEMSFSACGIDISHNNAGPIAWDSLVVMTDRKWRTVKSKEKACKVFPVKFVFIKASEGVSMKDPAFQDYWEEAGKRDLQRGAYHFFRSSKDGEAQARNFISTVGELRHSDLAPVLDIETIHPGCSRKTLNTRALKWLQTVEKHYGRKPIVYTSDSFARDILSDEITDNYPIWIAHYNVGSPDFQEWEYWQFTDRAYVYGVREEVDLSVRR